MKTWCLPYILTKPEDIDYQFSLIKETLPACFNPYTMQHHMGKALRKMIPTIQKERPELLQKLKRMGSPFTEICAEVTKSSKPI